MGTSGRVEQSLGEPVYAPAILAAMFGDAPGVVATVLETFSTSMALQMRLLQAAVGAEDSLSQQQIAHRIKGAARMSGALALAKSAERLEHAARGMQAGLPVQTGLGEASADVLRHWTQLSGDALFCLARRGEQAAPRQGDC